MAWSRDGKRGTGNDARLKGRLESDYCYDCGKSAGYAYVAPGRADAIDICWRCAVIRANQDYGPQKYRP